MCLYHVYTKKKFYKLTKDKRQYLNRNTYIGYRLVRIDEIDNTNEIFATHFKHRRPFIVNKVLKESSYRPYFGVKEIKEEDGNIKYPVGFHTLVTLKEALQYARSHFDSSMYRRIIQVYIPISKTVAYGIQDDCYTYVSTEMLIPNQFPISMKTGKQLKRSGYKLT